MKDCIGSILTGAWLSLGLVGVNGAGNQETVVVQNQGDTFYTNTTRKRYYCTFRNLWTSERHPYHYPLNGRWSAPFTYTHTLQFQPWMEGAATTVGIEKIAETGFTDTFVAEIINAGDQVYSYAEPEAGFFTSVESHINIPPFEVEYASSYMTAIAAMIPSPDWFSGFYSFWLVDEYTRMYYDHFIIKTYPWDAGTDSGDDYDSVDSDLFFPEAVTKFNTRTLPKGQIFLGPDYASIPAVAEWECFLHVGEEDLILPTCDYFKDPCCNATEDEECTDTGILGLGETPADRSSWYDDATSGASLKPIVFGWMIGLLLLLLVR